MLRTALSTSRHRGIEGVIDLIREVRQARQDKTRLQGGSRSSATVGKSSISDGDLYPLFCLLAANDDEVFSRFRRSLIYRRILEHVDESQGRAYASQIEQAVWMLSEVQALIATDTVGDPHRFLFKPFGTASPTTLRYLKVAADLKRLFGPLSGQRVAEIGVGYGGQCRLVKTLWAVKGYELYDIPEVLALAHRFLEASGVDLFNVIEKDGRDPQPAKIDLVISNYAFSELQRDVQELYWERVIQETPRGYMTYNHISPSEWESLKALDLARRIPRAVILPERPLTHRGNVILAWGMTS